MSDSINLKQNKTIVCRICGIESEKGQQLFSSNSDIEKLAVQICAYISIKLAKIQIYPNWICPGCHLQFEATNQFIELIRNGQNKLALQFGLPKKPSRKAKRKKSHRLIDDQVESLTANDVNSTELTGAKRISKRGRRILKTPRRYQDSMRGNELENLYSKIGVTKRKSKQNGKKSTEDHEGDEEAELIIDPHDPKNPTRYECNFCEQKFIKELAFFNHLSSHTNILYECIECQETFQAKSIFDRHVSETKHSGLGIIETPCLENPNENPDDPNTDDNPEHKSLTKKRRKFSCLKCAKTFTSNAVMSRHLATHYNYRPYKCDICSSSFRQKSVLDIHKITHTKECSFKCNKCPKLFRHQISLVRHLRTHDGLHPYSCTICKKSFNQQSHLKEHKRIHTGDRPYVCLICGISFKTSSQCRVHQKTHTIKKSKELKISIPSNNAYQCAVCKRLFANRNNLLKHKRLHTGEKPYVCHLCPKTFSDASNFKKHKQKHPIVEQVVEKPISLLKQNLNEVSLNSDLDEFIPTASFSILENTALPNSENSALIDIGNEDNVKNANSWNSDLIVTDIPDDENKMVQQEQLQQKLMNQVVCISYQDPMNPVSSKTTYYVVNQ